MKPTFKEWRIKTHRGFYVGRQIDHPRTWFLMVRKYGFVSTLKIPRGLGTNYRQYMARNLVICRDHVRMLRERQGATLEERR